MLKLKVAVIMGSDSDWPSMKDAVKILKQFDVKFVKKVVSAHRTPKLMYEFAKNAKKHGFSIIIAGAGGAAHLPGMVASLTELPVIGVPILSKNMDGLDSLLSIAQMPKGVPVATVAVGNSHNAALLAVKILALQDKKLAKKISSYTQSLEKKVRSMKLK